MSKEAMKFGLRVFAFVCFIALVLAVAVVLMMNQHHGATSRQESPTSIPTATPSSSPRVNDSGVSQDTKHDCRVVMSTDEYSAFVQRLRQFETVNLMPASAERLTQIEAFATKKFVASQKGFMPINTYDKSIQLHPESKVGCFMDEKNALTAYITPKVDIVDKASGKVVTSSLFMKTDYTQWVKTKGFWYVNQEAQ